MDLLSIFFIIIFICSQSFISFWYASVYKPKYSSLLGISYPLFTVR